MRDMSSTASAKYGNYHVQSGEDIAKMVANRKLSAADFTFTQTQGFNMGSVSVPGRFRIGTDDTDFEEFSIDSVVDGVVKYTKEDSCYYIEFDKILNASSVEVAYENGPDIVKLPFEETAPNKWTYFDMGLQLILPIDILVNGEKLFTIDYEES